MPARSDATTLCPLPAMAHCARERGGEARGGRRSGAARFRSKGCERSRSAKGYAIVGRPILIQRPKATHRL